MINNRCEDFYEVQFSALAFRYVLAGKYISSGLRQGISVTNQFAKGYKTISKQLGIQYFAMKKIIHK